MMLSLPQTARSRAVTVNWK